MAMETVEVERICKKCQSTFVAKKMCQTPLDAEIERNKMLKRKNPICPTCFKEEQYQQAVKKAADLGLPKIIGRTEKQIRYAFSLRDKYISQNKYKMRQAQKELDAINLRRVELVSKKHGYRSEDECIKDAFRRIELLEAYYCLTEPNASVLIEILAPKRDP